MLCACSTFKESHGQSLSDVFILYLSLFMRVADSLLADLADWRTGGLSGYGTFWEAVSFALQNCLCFRPFPRSGTAPAKTEKNTEGLAFTVCHDAIADHRMVRYRSRDYHWFSGRSVIWCHRDGGTDEKIADLLLMSG
jgi:hypothetical protein